MKAKTVLLGIGVAVAGLALVGWQKAKNLKDTFDMMSLVPVGIRKVDFISLTTTKLNVDIRLVNPTTQAFSINGVVATLKRLVVYYKGKYLGSADLNISAIDVPANGTALIKDIPVTVENLAAITVLLDLGNIDMKNLQITATIEALGSEYQITQ
jgi:hypothetical protein